MPLNTSSYPPPPKKITLHQSIGDLLLYVLSLPPGFMGRITANQLLPVLRAVLGLIYTPAQHRMFCFRIYYGDVTIA